MVLGEPVLGIWHSDLTDIPDESQRTSFVEGRRTTTLEENFELKKPLMIDWPAVIDVRRVDLFPEDCDIILTFQNCGFRSTKPNSP